MQMLDENHHLIQCIMDYQSKGKTAECTQWVLRVLEYVRNFWCTFSQEQYYEQFCAL